MSEKIVGSIATTETLKGDIYTVFAKDGKSAYEVAVKNGFKGTEAEWLVSLKAEITIDKVFNPTSENAQSGQAVAEAVADKMNKFGEVSTDKNTTIVEVGTDGKNFTLDGGANALELNAMRININNGMYSVVSGGNKVISADYGNLKLTGLVSPIDDTDAANKGYVTDYVNSVIGDINNVLATLVDIEGD